jgi:hypothetical protein
MLNWFKQKVISWVREDWNKARPEQDILVSPSTISKGCRLEQNGMNFTIYSANGGYVMEYSTYDHKTDRRDTALHIIPTDQDLGQGIAHIITFEMLRK